MLRFADTQSTLKKGKSSIPLHIYHRKIGSQRSKCTTRAGPWGYGDRRQGILERSSPAACPSFVDTLNAQIVIWKPFSVQLVWVVGLQGVAKWWTRDIRQTVSRPLPHLSPANKLVFHRPFVWHVDCAEIKKAVEKLFKLTAKTKRDKLHHLIPRGQRRETRRSLVFCNWIMHILRC